ncbi:MAG TPA: hypothetical protein VH092_22430 [Urbifossiella sp.]|jgi:hypothetical protein|nr:hypothetical protein [Urbifossiella sp.]
MTNEARLTIVIEEPTIPTAGGGGTGPSDDFPDWYPRFRELRNRADMGGALSDGERTELDGLSRKLTAYANQVTTPAAPPPLPPATGQYDANRDRSQITAGLPPVAEGFKRFYHGGVPYGSQGAETGGRWVAEDPIYARDYRSLGKPNTVNYVDIPLDHPALAGNGDFGMWHHFEAPPELASQLKVVPYSQPGGGPPPLPSATTTARPNPLLDDVFGVSPPHPPPPGPRPADDRTPGWDRAYRRPITGRAGDPGAFAQAATAANADYVAAARRKHTARLNDQFRGRIATGQRDREMQEQAFHMVPPRFRPLVGGAERAFAAGGEAAAGGAGLRGTLGAAAGGFGEGAMAAAGGPIGLAIAAAGLKDQVVQGAVDGIKGLGTEAKKLAGNDGFGLLQDGANATGKLLGMIPIVGAPLGDAFKIATAGVNAFRDTAYAFADRGRELAGYNGYLATSEANREVSGIRSDIREADETGLSLSILTDAITRMEAAMRELWLPIKSFVVDVLAGTVLIVEDVAKAILEFIAAIAPEKIAEYARKLLEAMKGEPTDDILQDWLRATDNLRPSPAGPRPEGGAPPMQLPIFSR